MLENLLTERPNPASERIDARPVEEILRIINSEDDTVPSAVAAAIPQIAKAVDAIETVLRNGGRLYYLGAGTSGRLGVLDAAECPPTFQVDSSLVQGVMAGGERALARATEASEDDGESGWRDLLEKGFSIGDVVTGIAASGRTPYVVGAMRKARELGAWTVGICCTPDSELSRAVAIPIEVLTGPEVITGSTRMKAGTATKLVLNMLSTATMIRLGYVYGNLMVNVQPRNRKLAERGGRIIASVAGIPLADAAALLQRTGKVRTAIVMAKRGVVQTEAERMLEAVGGVLRRALET